MRPDHNHRTIITVILFLTFIFWPCYQNANATGCDCSQDTAIPPFLSAGATPNLLLMIDNSASMLDPNYAEEGGEYCFDDSYDATSAVEITTGAVVFHTPYAGYFEMGTPDQPAWYQYNSGSGKFEISAAGECSGGTAAYSNDYACVVMSMIDVDGVDTLQLDSFKATGHFLNWVSASKFDIQKLVLTGGKYDADAGVLESEGRGCSGNRFIKQVDIFSNGTTYKLVLGVRSDYDKDDNLDPTLIDVFQITVNGFQPGKCQEAIDLMMGPPTGFGQVKNAVVECMEYDITNQHTQAGEHDKQALMHSLHDCWYLDKQGSWPPGGAQGFNFEKWCEDVYTRIDPRNITPDDEAYVCYGNGATAELEGFIGECWQPTGACHYLECGERALEEREDCRDGYIQYCTNWNSGRGVCKNDDDWVKVQECEGGGEAAGWKWEVNSDDLTACIEAARERFCGYIKTPQVTDPSDLQSTTSGETWNIPAMIMSQGAAGQLGTPVATLTGKIEKADAPAGLLQEYSGGIRIGAMAFQDEGSASECDMPLPYVSYNCENSAGYVNKDGAKVIQGISSDIETPGHTDGLVNAINSTLADTWTPLAEAMYTAIGYYTQRADLELNAGEDFTHLPTAPITEYCQSNNVLFVTDGASTADLNPLMVAKAGGIMADDPNDGDSGNDCGDLYGSTYFDDLAYYARQSDSLYTDSPYAFDDTPNNINSWIVFTGKKDETNTSECNPWTLMSNAVANGGPNATDPDETDAVLEGTTPSELKTAIENALKDILKRAAAGSAASVIAATRSGEGAVYQAIFWPGQDGPTNLDGSIEPDVLWTGEVHSLLIDGAGSLHEDTNGNAILDSDDQKVVFFFDESDQDAPRTRACYGSVSDGVCSGSSVELSEVKYLWSAVEWLDEIADADLDSNRFTYLSGEKKRYVFTWNDLNNDGKVDGRDTIDSDELVSFVPAKDWAGLTVIDRTGTVPHDFGVATDAEVDTIVSWIRGKDDPMLRPRKVQIGETVIDWRLGDVIHSTPTSVGAPAENYHMIYRDFSYADFAKQYKNRRHVVYFGANDGMIHAVNGGFYNADAKAFCLTADGATSGDYPALGAELWAYVPYNLQPQLKCLTDPLYQHRYYVDQKPRVFDVRIFDDDTDHPNGWGTIMVVGMRLGGNPVKADAVGDTRQFTSAYVVFDITNPDKPPTLLGELTYDASSSVNLGYTTPIPAVIPMKNEDTTKWYLILGSGPNYLDAAGEWVSGRAIEGVSNQTAKVAVFPLDELTTGSGKFRIPDALPSIASEKGRYELPGAGFVSDLITVDFDLTKNYKADAVYFGTVEGDYGAWGGKMYRIVTNADDLMTTPHEWTIPSLMYDVGRPITAAASAGWDGENFWVYFGTGRFFSPRDKSDPSSNAQESYYGLKEPIDCNTGEFTWAEIDPADVTTTSQIQVNANDFAQQAALSCSDASACLPADVSMFDDLVDYIAGEGCNDENQPTGTAGWKLDFPDPRERNLGQATLFGGLVTFTTYQPFDDVCLPEGLAFLYAPYYQTGTAWHEPVFRGDIGLDGDYVVSRLAIGRGLATTPNLHVGSEEGGDDEEGEEGDDGGGGDEGDDTSDGGGETKAIVQTSTGEIIEIEQPNLPVKAARTGRMSWRTD